MLDTPIVGNTNHACLGGSSLEKIINEDLGVIFDMGSPIDKLSVAANITPSIVHNTECESISGTDKQVTTCL